MRSGRRARDHRLLDALEQLPGQPFDAQVWRVTREARSVFEGSLGGGRWNPSELSVLYAAGEADGALAEMFFHLNRGQSVFPSRLRHVLYRLRVRAERVLWLTDKARLDALGVEPARYREMLYRRCREIGDAAAFLGFSGLVAPSARFQCDVLVLFLDSVDTDSIEVLSQEPIDWDAWRERR